MWRFIISCVGLLFPLYSFSQVEIEHTDGLILPYWSAGSIVMADGEATIGRVRFNLIDDPSKIELRVGESEYDIPVRDLKELEFADSISGQVRRYLTIPLGRRKNLVLMEGRGESERFALISYKYIKTVTSTSLALEGVVVMASGNVSGTEVRRNSRIKEERYILVKSIDKILPLSYGSVMKICETRKYAVAKFIRDNDLTIDDFPACLRVLEYFESVESE